MNEIKIGDKNKQSVTVTEENIALTVGSGNVEVYATPMMICLMEATSAELLNRYLDETETSVGTYIETSHIAATPIELEVCAEAEVIDVKGREITFKVIAKDNAGLIGEGIHKRVIVDYEKFSNKADEKLRTYNKE